MTEPVDPSAVRRLLDQARGQRSQIVRGAPLPIDTAHVVGACPACGHLGATILGFPDPPYAGPQGQPRYRTARELQRFIDEIIKNPPPLPAADDPSTPSTNPQQPGNLWKGVCVCGAKINPPQPDPRTGETVADPEATPRQVCGVRFIKAMPGAGAELVVEALSGGDGGVPYTDGVTIKYRVLRAPLDGDETEVSASLDDSPIAQSFGRPLTLAATWKSLLDRAAQSESAIEQAENGYWLWAGPKDSPDLDANIKEITDGNVDRVSHGLVEIPNIAPMPQGPAFPAWAYEHAKAIFDGELRAGVVIDLSVVKRLTAVQIERAGLIAREEKTPDGKIVALVATAGDVVWPAELLIIGLGAAHLGWYLGETAAAAAGETLQRVAEIKRYVDAVRSERPDMTFHVRGLQLFPTRADGQKGRPVDLRDLPFRAPPGSPDFKRELRFVCDDLPKGADPTRRCPCGERAWVSARLFPDKVVEEFKSATQGKSPKIVEEWKNGALVATISCDRHVRIPTADEIEGSGLKGEAFDKRMAEDMPNSVFAVDVALFEDKNKKRALLAFGPLVASVVMNDHLVSGLHQACRQPDGALPLRTTEAEAVVTSPNILCLHEPGFDDDRLDEVLDQGAAMDGYPQDAALPFDLLFSASLKAAPLGKFMNLRPPPQGQQPQGAPPSQQQQQRR